MRANLQGRAAAETDASARWDDVKVFLAAHRHRTLGAAAQKLGFDISTMSRRLTAFEASVGARLFDRSREGLVPTKAAESVLAAAEAMEAAHARLTRDAQDVESAAEGPVRLSVAPGFADQIIAPLLVKLRQRYPKIHVELEGSTRAVDLTRREADLALRSVAPKGAELLVTKLGSAQWVPVASPALAKKLGRLKAWRDAPWIVWDRDMQSFPSAQWVVEHVPDADVALRTSLFTAQLVAAETGLGVVLAPGPHLRGRTLMKVPFASSLEADAAKLPVDVLWLVGHKALRDVPRVAAVWNFLLESLKGAYPAEAA